ncbi:MAG: hypothetical protein NZM38_04345 [Cytophagales bacterium]|nr:hypothetical protein [Cytophagales bacterium]MDW8383982.1 hypothetical protein [Flammeovirgaceae bacterium]
MRVLFGFLLLFTTFDGKTQNVIGKFSKNSLKIGDTIQYTLICQHAPEIDILFPDSSYDFSPFEYISHTYFPTITQEGVSTDKVIYTLTTFETDSALKIGLPVFILKKGKRDSIFAEPEIISLESVLIEGDNQLKINTDWVKVHLKFDYYFWGIFSAILIGACGIFLALFGKRIWRAWKRRQLQKAHLKFILELDKYFENYNNTEQLEHGLALWKSYLAKLTEKPISSLTSKEITQVFAEKANLNASLKTIDKKLYGGIDDVTLKDALHYLKEVAIEEYEKEYAKL